MSLPVRFSAEAASELNAAAAWYDVQQPGLGETFLDAVDVTLGYLSDWPGSGSPVPGVPAGPDVRRAPVARFPYHLPYVVLENHLRILAVAHDRQRPRYWAPRVVD